MLNFLNIKKKKKIIIKNFKMNKNEIFKIIKSKFNNNIKKINTLLDKKRKKKVVYIFIKNEFKKI
ncbi:MAG: hypothetical protein ABNO60_00660 [Candidatus Shikimatogenerans sp. Tcar]|uniref:50S ribosomal protein L23 n=1 Tax=Candidatus Shikimatogenerans sp. Tcar TaxID=3158565 RepID=A0AAU7QU97_9FLAO